LRADKNAGMIVFERNYAANRSNYKGIHCGKGLRMRLAMEMREWSQKMHNWEHNLLLSSERLIHREAFWTMVILTLAVVGLILLTIFAWNSGGSRPHYPTPFYPYMPY